MSKLGFCNFKIPFVGCLRMVKRKYPPAAVVDLISDRFFRSQFCFCRLPLNRITTCYNNIINNMMHQFRRRDAKVKPFSPVSGRSAQRSSVTHINLVLCTYYNHMRARSNTIRRRARNIKYYYYQII